MLFISFLMELYHCVQCNEQYINIWLQVVWNYCQNIVYFCTFVSYLKLYFIKEALYTAEYNVMRKVGNMLHLQHSQSFAIENVYNTT